MRRGAGTNSPIMPRRRTQPSTSFDIILYEMLYLSGLSGLVLPRRRSRSGCSCPNPLKIFIQPGVAPLTSICRPGPDPLLHLTLPSRHRSAAWAGQGVIFRPLVGKSTGCWEPSVGAFLKFLAGTGVTRSGRRGCSDPCRLAPGTLHRDEKFAGSRRIAAPRRIDRAQRHRHHNPCK